MFIVVWIICYFYYNWRIEVTAREYKLYGILSERIKNGWTVTPAGDKLIVTKDNVTEYYELVSVYKLLQQDGLIEEEKNEDSKG